MKHLAPFLCVVLAAAQPAPGPVERLQGWLDGTRSLAGEFEQTLVSGALGAGLSERGTLYLERPGHLRWDYTDPESKIAIVIGDRTWLYLAEDRQLVRGHLDLDEGLLPSILAGGARLADLFEARAEEGRGESRVTLVPRRTAGAVERIVLTCDGRSGEIRAAEILDAAGTRTAFRFSKWRRNGTLPPGLFAFEPPAGTEVVEQP